MENCDSIWLKVSARQKVVGEKAGRGTTPTHPPTHTFRIFGKEQ